MGKIAFVFAGQGAQYPGMGQELAQCSPAAAQVFQQLDALRPGTSQQCFSGTEAELKETRNTQPCLYCVDLAAACALREAGVAPAALAGFSLGEIAALTFSGAVSPEDGFSIVCARGEAMQAAAEQTDAAMVAVVKLDNATVEGLCARFRRVYPVNYNCPGQLVVAGAREELEPFSYFDTPYRLRGQNRELAVKQGLPTELDRLVLRAVSVLHLAHWRDKVTIQSYYFKR